VPDVTKIFTAADPVSGLVRNWVLMSRLQTVSAISA
jgi:hypothetical protein